MSHHVYFERGECNNDNVCNNDCIPSTPEYLSALGLYGIWLLIIGGISTLLLYAVFLEQVFFSQRGAHRVFRRHIYWIASVYPFMTMMSLASVIVPRAFNICTAVRGTYMAIGITHFADLTVLMYGSEEVMIAKTQDHRLNLNVGPVCCCCCCLPSPKVTKMSLRCTMFMINQLSFSQAFYYITLLILIAGDNVVLGDVNPKSIYLWLSLLNMICFMSGVWGLQILCRISNTNLKHYNYTNKSFSMKTLVMVTNLQAYILNSLGNYNVFPCIPPHISPQVFRQTVENSLYFLEMLLLGCYTYYQYHNQEFVIPNPTEMSFEDGRRYCRSDTVSTTASAVTHCEEIEHSNRQLGVISEEPSSVISEVFNAQRITDPEKPGDISPLDWNSLMGAGNVLTSDSPVQPAHSHNEPLSIQMACDQGATGRELDTKSSSSSSTSV